MARSNTRAGPSCYLLGCFAAYSLSAWSRWVTFIRMGSTHEQLAPARTALVSFSGTRAGLPSFCRNVVLRYFSVEARNAHRIPVRAGEAALPGLRHNIRDYRPE